MQEELRHLLRGVQHERLDVRLHALKALHNLLQLNRVRVVPLVLTFLIITCAQVKLQNYMVDSDTVDPIITEIVTIVSLVS